MASIPHNIPTVSDSKAQQSERYVGANDPVNSHTVPHQTNLQADRSNQNNSGGILSGATESLATVGETAKQYIPTSVMNTLQNVGIVGQDTNSTLPSQETRFSGSRGGVGTLPGRPSEPEVAKLPEERRLEKEVGHPLGREGVLNTVAEEKPIGLAESLELDRKTRATDPTAGTTTAAKFINLDAIPTPGETPRGDLTQHGNDVDVDKPLPPPGSDTTYAKDQAKRQAAKTEPMGHASKSGQAAKTEPMGHASKSGPTTEHKEHVEQKKDIKDRGTVDSTNNAKESAKPSFGQKIKGEVKVLSGKLANNPSKVEAGQAMKKGTSD